MIWRTETKSKNLAYDLLRAFSRFEYSLKATKFLRAGRGGGAEADWDKFARAIGKKSSPDAIVSPTFKKAVLYFYRNPPKKQIVNEHEHLAWQEHAFISEAHRFDDLLILVRRVRNNLFHGGKSRGEYIYGSERDKVLIKHSLVILGECLHLDGDVEREFNNEVHNVYDE